ncbi:MAG: acyl-[acyl-carrier-protein]--UDP-N-acetylglucosamine O-acyltransferase [Alphaproteobacteria bacterium]|nr:acyl-[acyl-carrier-protein]--UDP-N-acetylglucosamine O-acyltransferase [Alphaproteobacteria bacterium]HCP01164.1 acyl-[acyl-carrier-protein]--UDP-N-acetylglucosamine O-acyltransferase [Rhodospirillaceae bacterium]
MNDIHPTAVVEDGAKIGTGVKVGPYCIIGENVELGDGVRLHSHTVVGGRTRIGAETDIYPFASIGLPPQDLKFSGEESELLIGARTRIREHVTMNPGTSGGGLITSVGDDCLFMVGSHVAHDCHVGNNVILANNATLAGHVHVGDFAIIGGLAAIHQFVRIGAHAMVGGMSGVEHDLIPYGSAMGERARLRGLNLVGLQRRDFSRDEIHHLRTAYRLLFAQEGTMQERVESVVGLYGANEGVMEIVDFVREETSRAVLQPKSTNGT